MERRSAYHEAARLDRQRSKLAYILAGIATGLVGVSVILNASPLGLSARALANEVIETVSSTAKEDKRVVIGSHLTISGEELPIIGDPGVQGLVSMQRKADRLVFTGWAADVGRGAAIDRVVIVVNSIYAEEAQVGLPKPAVAQRLGAAFAKSGFTVSIPIEMAGAASRSLRLFAINKEGKASEIRLTKKAAELLKSRRVPDRVKS